MYSLWHGRNLVLLIGANSRNGCQLGLSSSIGWSSVTTKVKPEESHSHNSPFSWANEKNSSSVYWRPELCNGYETRYKNLVTWKVVRNSLFFHILTHTHIAIHSIATVQKLLKPNENAIAKNGIYEQLFEPSSRIFGMIEATGISCVLSIERQTIKLTELR